MVIAVDAVFEGGLFRPKSPVPLQEHEEVRLVIETTAGAAADPAVDFVGFIKDAPEGEPLAADHDSSIPASGSRWRPSGIPTTRASVRSGRRSARAR